MSRDCIDMQQLQRPADPSKDSAHFSKLETLPLSYSGLQQQQLGHHRSLFSIGLWLFVFFALCIVLFLIGLWFQATYTIKYLPFLEVTLHVVRVEPCHSWECNK